ncbi:autotransporter domain-containing protein [Paraburkholderia sp. J67]|uniref:autotransporter domain-containing protein n=1 Tax=Paraburkholderia sp. J67 TaxID=2805435 RepID=UPI002ABE2E8E|nr:autotransporter domain-containing protein [Paraburkholderia sp. J67]
MVSASQSVFGVTGLMAVNTVGTLTNYGTISGETGVFAFFATISSIANSGTISGYSTGLYSIESTIDTLTNTGTISGSTAGILNDGTIGSLINSGVITGTYGVFNESAGSIGTLVDTGWIGTSGADITIASGTVSSAELTVTNEGTIGTAIESGIYNSVSITGITNNATITAGTGLTILGTAAGTQTSAGIYNDTTGTIGTLTNSGVISGGDYGILNKGTIETLANTGTISGADESIWNQGTIVSLVDAGSITASGADVTIASGSTLTAPTLSVYNTGTIGLAVEAGIYNDESITGITNNGTIDAGTGLTLSGSGTSSSVLSGIYNDASGTIGSLTNNSSGAIGSTDTEAGVINYGSIDALNNSGTIAGDFAAYNDGSIGTLTNSGTIKGNDYGVVNIATIDSLINSGTIAASFEGVLNLGTIGTVNNSGTISSTDYAFVNDDGRIGTLSNSGLITAGDTAIKTSAGTIGTLSNSGTISGNADGVYVDGTIGALDNSGTISGGQYAIYNASTGTIGTFRNSGVIEGNIANLSSTALTITGGDGTIFGTLTGYGDTIGTITSDAGVNFSSGNILLNDNINVGSGTVSNTSATLEVDNTVTITGNYSQGEAATLLVGVSSGTSYGSLVVTGDSTIASGSSVELKSTSGYGFAAGQRYVVVQTEGTATYNASTLKYSVAGYSSGATGSVTTSNGDTDLVVTLNSAASDTGTGTGTDTGTGTGSDSGSGSSSSSGSGGDTTSTTSYASRATQTNAENVLTGLLGYSGTSNAQLLNLYDATLAAIESGSSATANRVGNQLSPLQTQRVGTVSTLDAMSVVGTHLDALRVAQGQGATGLSTGDNPLNWTAWGQAFGGHASQNERDNVAGYSANYGGLVLGADRAFGDAWRVGGAFHYSHTATNYSDDQAGDSAGINAFGLIGYASYQGAPWYVNVSGAVTQQHYDTTRVVSMTGYEGVANGSFNGQQYAAHVEFGWPLAVASATLTPLASFTYSRLNQSGYTETGGNGSALTVGSLGTNSLRSAIGAKLEKAYETSYGLLVPVVWAQWIHEYDQTRQNTAAYFSGAADETGFTTTGATPVSNLADLSLGVTLVRANNLSLSLRYDLQVGSGFVSNTGILRLQQKF